MTDLNGTNAHQITNNNVPESEPSLSPDGSQVMFLSQANAKFDTYYNRKIFVAPAARRRGARADARSAV